MFGYPREVPFSTSPPNPRHGRLSFTFFLSPERLELSRDESRRWFQSADPWKSPSGSLTPSRASREFRSGKRKSGELRWCKRGRGARGWGYGGEDGGVFHIDTLSYSSYPLAISPSISPSCLIELLVYTYTTHNDSWERKEHICLCFFFPTFFPQPIVLRYLNIYFGKRTWEC